MRAALAFLLLLAGCSGGGVGSAPNAAEPQDLESAAIERGVVRDPKDREIAGLYARDTDRLCIVHNKGEYRIGAFVDYGDRITCSGSGKVTRSGETLHIELGGVKPEGGAECSFEARVDGDKISFPGNVPDGCQTLCAKRASYAGLEVTLLSESAAEARAMRDSSGKALCGG